MTTTAIIEPAVRDFAAKVAMKYADTRGSFLLGSQARGTADRDSDVDVLILLEQADHSIKRSIIDLAYDLYLETGVDISPLVMSVDEYQCQQRIGIPLIAEVERDKTPL